MNLSFSIHIAIFIDRLLAPRSTYFDARAEQCALNSFLLVIACALSRQSFSFRQRDKLLARQTKTASRIIQIPQTSVSSRILFSHVSVQRTAYKDWNFH